MKRISIVDGSPDTHALKFLWYYVNNMVEGGAAKNVSQSVRNKKEDSHEEEDSVKKKTTIKKKTTKI
jgi:hypothetical protein